jgi:hypothetical protein
MPFDEFVTPGWSLAYPPARPAGAQPVRRQPGRLPSGRVYPTWSLAYPPQPAPPPEAATDAVSSDTATRLLQQVFADHSETGTENVS